MIDSLYQNSLIYLLGKVAKESTAIMVNDYFGNYYYSSYSRNGSYSRNSANNRRNGSALATVKAINDVEVRNYIS